MYNNKNRNFTARSTDEVVIEPINPRIKQFIVDRNLYVLRDAKTGNALNVSYSEDGLKWTTNAAGKLLYYQNGMLAPKINVKKSTRNNELVFDYVTIVPRDGQTLRKSNRVYVEKFIPTDRNTLREQIAEYTWTDKAYRLLVLNAPSFEA